MSSKSSLYRKRKRELGICLHCTSPAAVGKAYCERCRTKLDDNRRRRTVEVKSVTGRHPRATLAQRNKSTVMDHYGPGCRECSETILAFLTLDHIDNNGAAERRSGLRGGADLYSRLINSGFPSGYQCLCWNCNHLKEYVRSRPEPEAIKARYRRDYKDKLTREVLDAYGSACSCCGHKDLRVLTIDHIGGGGKQHLKSLKANPTKFYCWLRANRYPIEFRVLCRNCNSGRAISDGVCPHLWRARGQP